MWHIFKGLHIFLDFDGVGERFDSIFILVLGRKKTVWNCNGRPVLGVYHGRMAGWVDTAATKGVSEPAAKVAT